MKSGEKSSKGKPNNKKTLMIVGGIAVAAIIVIVIALVVILSFGRSPQDSNQNDYKIVDLTNKPVAEACSIVKANGWEVIEPIEGQYSSSPKIDCENTYAAVESYHYNKSAHTVKIKWDYHRLTEDEYKGKTISEICEFGKQYQLTVDPTSIFGSTDEDNEYVRSCDDNRIPDKVVQEGKIMHFVFAKGTKPSSSSSSSSSTSSSSDSTSSSSTSNSSSSSSSSSSTDANFRKVMSDYENFMNKYVDFMKKYKNSSDTTSMLSEYSSLMQDYAKFADSIKGYDQSNLSASDWAYYLEVTARVTKKLSEI